MSDDLAETYCKLLGINVTEIIKVTCTDQGNVNKVFSHSIRAFLLNKSLEYTKEDPPFEPPLGDTTFTTVKTTVPALIEYDYISETLVNAYAKIADVTKPDVKQFTCNNLKDVCKVLSHSARAFLASEAGRLLYDEGEPVNH